MKFAHIPFPMDFLSFRFGVSVRKVLFAIMNIVIVLGVLNVIDTHVPSCGSVLEHILVIAQQKKRCLRNEYEIKRIRIYRDISHRRFFGGVMWFRFLQFRQIRSRANSRMDSGGRIVWAGNAVSVISEAEKIWTDVI